MELDLLILEGQVGADPAACLAGRKWEVWRRGSFISITKEHRRAASGHSACWALAGPQAMVHVQDPNLAVMSKMETSRQDPCLDGSRILSKAERARAKVVVAGLGAQVGTLSWAKSQLSKQER